MCKSADMTANVTVTAIVHLTCARTCRPMCVWLGIRMCVSERELVTVNLKQQVEGNAT